MGSLKDLSQEIEQLVDKASKSVVRVDARRGRAGTGIVWDGGLVLTANHVVEQEDDITVVVDDKTSKATLVGRDPATDLALLKVDGLSAPAMPRAKVDGLKPGQIVLAIGRPGSLKATFGTISAVSSSWRGWRGSEIEHLIQTNAPLYPGFSGGPLVDSQSRVIGVNTAIIASAQGICFAIGINAAKHILPQLMKHGRVMRGYLGLHAHPVPIPVAVARQFGLTQTRGVEVQMVEPDGPADQAGLQEGDVIIAFGDHPATSIDDLHKLLTQLPVGIPAGVVFLRGERRLERFVVPGEYPNPAPRA